MLRLRHPHHAVGHMSLLRTKSVNICVLSFWVHWPLIMFILLFPHNYSVAYQTGSVVRPHSPFLYFGGKYTSELTTINR